MGQSYLLSRKTKTDKGGDRVMKKDPDCYLILDLLPNYMEKLTSDETNLFIESHLEHCDQCQKTYITMSKEIKDTIPYPAIEFKFLKKIKRTKLLGAGLSVLLAFIFSFMVYSAHFSMNLDQSELSIAITKFLEPNEYNGTSFDAYVLETKEVDGILMATFKNENQEYRNGIALFKKGLNGKYAIYEVQTAMNPNTSIVQFFHLTLKNENYIAVSGYNLAPNIKEYSLDYSTYTTSEALSDFRIKESLKFPVKNQQFITLYAVEELENLLSKVSENTMNPHYLTEGSFYNEDGIEITPNFTRGDDFGDFISTSGGYRGNSILYVSIFFIFGFGAIMTRYFLTD